MNRSSQVNRKKREPRELIKQGKHASQLQPEHCTPCVCPQRSSNKLAKLVYPAPSGKALPQSLSPSHPRGQAHWLRKVAENEVGHRRPELNAWVPNPPKGGRERAGTLPSSGTTGCEGQEMGVL